MHTRALARYSGADGPNIVGNLFEWLILYGAAARWLTMVKRCECEY